MRSDAAPEVEAAVQVPQAVPAAETFAARSYEQGLEQGLYEGGEQLLEQLTPPGFILPGVTVKDVLAAGVAAVQHQALPLLSAQQVAEAFAHATATGSPLSVVRLGDGELLALAQEVVYPTGIIRHAAPFLTNSGVQVPDLAARDQLAEALRKAHIVGVPISRRRFYQPLLVQVLRAHGIALEGLRLTTSTVNYQLQEGGLLRPLLSGKRLLLVGNASPALAAFLVSGGFTVAGVIAPVRGMGDVERVMGEAAGCPFDLALVSAGIPAVVICSRLAVELGRAALDFGHLADQFLKGQAQL